MKKVKTLAKPTLSRTKKKSAPKPTSDPPKALLKQYFRLSFKEALNGVNHKHGGPFGAIIVLNGKIIGVGHNTVLKDNDPSCHAEVNAIRDACRKLKRPHLENSILIASSEPCPMCLTTSYWAQIGKIYYALPRKIAAKYGFIDDFIYLDLKKASNKRKLQVSSFKDSFKSGLAVFKKWHKLNGKLY